MKRKSLLLLILASSFHSSAFAWTLLEDTTRLYSQEPEAQGSFTREDTMNVPMIETQRPLAESAAPKPLPVVKSKAELSQKATQSVSKTLMMSPEKYSRKDMFRTQTEDYEKISYQSFEKHASNLSGDEQVTMNYVSALECLNTGKEPKAEQLFAKNLELQPNHKLSRLQLANLYFKNHRDMEAELILSEGLKQEPENADMLKMMASTLERRGEYQLALSSLNKIPQDKKNDKSTAMLLGQVYQKTGHYGLAKQQYNRLMQFEPNNPLWMLGVSMALEGEGKKKEALQNYQKIKQSACAEPSMINYIDSRLTSLK